MFYKLLYFVISTYFAIIIEIINLKTFCVFLFLFKILKTIIVTKHTFLIIKYSNNPFTYFSHSLRQALNKFKIDIMNHEIFDFNINRIINNKNNNTKLIV